MKTIRYNEIKQKARIGDGALRRIIHLVPVKYYDGETKGSPPLYDRQKAMELIKNIKMGKYLFINSNKDINL